MKKNIIGCTRVKNGERFIRRWIQDMSLVCDSLCILDDNSTDGTSRIIREEVRNNPNIFVRWSKNTSRNGGRDCNDLWSMASSLSPGWIFGLDVDEFIEPEVLKSDTIRQLAEVPEYIHGWDFPFFYLWDSENRWRCDGWYGKVKVIRLFRFFKDQKPPNRPAHATMCPDELDRRRVWTAPFRILHYGYMLREDRQAKYNFYTTRDDNPEKAGGGVKNYDHIIQDGKTKPVAPHLEWRYSQEPEPIAKGPLNTINRNHMWSGGSNLPGYVVSNGSDILKVKNQDHIVVLGVPAHLNESNCVEWFKDIIGRLKVGGRLDVRVPEITPLCKRYVDSETIEDRISAGKGLFRISILPDNAYLFWTERTMEILNKAGISRVEILDKDDGHVFGYRDA